METPSESTSAPTPTPAPATPTAPLDETSERELTKWMHLGPLIASCATIISLGALGFAPVITSLVLWYVNKDKSNLVDAHGKEALNFQLTLLFVYIAAGFIGVVGLIFCIGPLIAFFLAVLTAIASVIFTFLATQAASKGQMYKYPATIRLVK